MPETFIITLSLPVVVASVISFGLGFLSGGMFITTSVNRHGYRWKRVAGKVQLVKIGDA